MPLFWVLLWSALPPLALFSGPDRCSVQESSSLQNELLKSLQCYNDYLSHVECEWREHRDTALQLWFKADSGRRQCLPHSASVHDEHRTVRCRYETKLFVMALNHTVFFLENKTEALCTSGSNKTLDLSQHLRARPPVDLTVRDAGDRGRRLSWSSPYPSTSSLNKNITYQLSYRTDGEDIWTVENVTNTNMKLEKQLLLPGRRYEARVRARASVAQWSLWSPVVTWQTEEDAGQIPRVHCVLDGEKTVMCSWEVSRELARLITYQLSCRHKQSASSERCCVNPTVTPDLSGTVLKYSCSLTVADPAHQQLELRPTRNAKIFEASKHIRPNPPLDVKVRNKGSSWIVDWTNPANTSPRIRLYYQLCYYRTKEQNCSTRDSIRTIPQGSMSLTILQDDLVPSQDYQVRVRSLVAVGHESSYDGIPSDWTDPVDWISNEASWSINTLIYFSIGALVVTVFLTLYCTIPACQRRVVLWVDSVPSPAKSKILAEIKYVDRRTFMQGESMSVCKVQRFDSMSTCSSDTSLWPAEDSGKQSLKQDEGCWRCDNQPSLAVEVKISDGSSFSFSGPYIFCQTSEANSNPVDVQCEETETLPDDPASPSPVNFTLYGKGYVCLPSRNVSRSTQDLASHSDANADTLKHGSPEQDQHRPGTTLCPADETDVQPAVDEPSISPRPPDYISGPLTAWPQGGNTQASGYCFLPQPT
ncbi:cytokine receptor common subunit beta isoform X2 [Acanthopagrus latus]|uniref:cytokine receptor common subunit beta isoform X2 n=1 Tax=Acanthopagrus latus TaxID=8177 RepID=UPI00187CDF83|nr:cytokine receptor common subunit beta isoform X2 [Acanthopagrus latus]